MHTCKQPLESSDAIYAKDSRHKWHSFPAKYPPELPCEFIEKYTSIGETVFDPMSGSGTTLIEAQRLNRKSIGVDVDPLSIINLNGKFSTSDPRVLESAYNQILENVRTMLSDGSDAISDLIDKRFSNTTKEFIDYWFPEDSIAQLTAISDQILNLSDNSVRDFFLMVLSATIITKHGNVCYAADLAHTRPHKVVGKKVTKPLDEFERKYRSIIKDQINHFLLNKSNRPIVCYGDARFLNIDVSSIDLIVTSPPYANNAIDYLRAHKFALIWMGYSIEQISNIRQNMVGEVSRLHDSQILPEKTRLIVAMIKQSNKSKGNKLEKYYKDISQMMRKISEVLKPGKHAIIVVASSVIDGIDVLTHECIIDIAQKGSLCLEDIQSRDIDRNKRMMPVSNVINKNSQIETRMHVEYIIDFKKV
jgi:DNA modification methylase